MAMIVDAFAGKLVERLTNVIEEKAIMVLGVKDELQRLRRRMERIAHVLKDAERRRIQDETVKGWVYELKDLMYDAEDIIDLCMIQGTGLLQDDDHHSPAKSNTASTRVRCNFPLFSCVSSVPLRYEIADKIENLNDRLTEISEDKDKFSFITSSKSSDAYVTNEASSHQSSSLPDPDIVGWDIRDATKSLVELLITTHHEHKCRLFAIVGMGGIGKTTLAQQIYNDSKINDGFLLHSWVWVSKSFTSKTDLLKEIIRNTGGSYGESTTTTELQKILCSVLNEKSLFLVLDDVWDADVWTDLIKTPIERTTTKCRVLITTRDRNTASKMGAMHIHNVNKLPLDSGWELLCKKVFINNDERDIHRMKDVGMQIVEKCDGLPVAIKVIAGVLVTKDLNIREWENVLNSDAWTITGLPEELRGALYLSYEDLPSALKNCFLHCSLHPRDHAFYREDLVCEWIAEGFIEAKGNALMEEVAKSYYMELIKRSFFQPDPFYVNMWRCTMHDLLLALACVLAGDENCSGDLEEAPKSTLMKKRRRLTISSNRESVSIPHLDYLRSLYLLASSSFDVQMIGKLRHLRLLVLNGLMIENIPDSIGDLVHLRLLDLDYTSIPKLPNSVGNLVNLQFLSLDDCESLHIIPSSITKLCNLRKLSLTSTCLNYVPKGIGKLKHLNHIAGFVIRDHSGGDGAGEGCDLEELQTLEKLYYLGIDNLEKATKGVSVLSNKCHLIKLILSCTANTNGHIHQEQEMERIVQVFDELWPPACLERLWIYDYFGCQYPKWMSSASISTALREVTILHLVNCSNCPQLPQLGQLPQLNYLRIDGATAVVSIGSEFLGSGEVAASAFPMLEFLALWNMTNWKEWSLISTGEEEEDIEPHQSRKLLLFPKLKKILIDNCPKLIALPRGLNCIRELEIRDAHSLSRISHLPALKELEVIDCRMLQCVEKLESLQSLKLTDDQETNNMSTLPEWLISFLQQREKPHDDRFILHLECSAQALKKCLKGRSYWVFLQEAPRLVAYADNQSMYLKYTKETDSYETNMTDDQE